MTGLARSSKIKATQMEKKMQDDLICEIQSDELTYSYLDMQEMEQYLQIFNEIDSTQMLSEQDSPENFEDFPF